ncbi:MAG TPA: hypothetical protein VGN17_31370 [Bryobacteraceae bacterium]|jgi:hypothetical protein
MDAGWQNAYDEDESIIYLLDGELKIARCNPAWDRFALANGGERAVAARVTGTHVMDVVPPPLTEFYSIAYGNVRKFRKDWWHVFECSSAAIRRVFQMRILPAREGLLVVNTLIRETPAEAGEHGPPRDYDAGDGMLTACSHCRRVRNVRMAGRWDWAPEVAWSGELLTVFDLCEFCRAYHSHRGSLDRV